MVKELSIGVQRDRSIDATKFMLIAFVVFGHMLETDTSLFINERLRAFVYSFHMPAFIVLSGYFFHKGKRFWKGILGLAIVWVIFQILYFGDPIDVNGGGQIIDGLLDNLIHFYKPASVLWYIFSLICWRIITYYTPEKMIDKPSLMLLMAFIASIVACFVPLGRELSFQRTFAFYPWFLVGYYAARFNLWYRLQHTSIWLSVLVVLGYFVLIFLLPFTIPQSMLVEFFSFWEYPQMPVLRVISYLWMFPITLAMLRLLSCCKVFASEGSKTMFYFIYHVYLIWALRMLVKTLEFPTEWYFIVIYTIFALCILWSLNNIQMLRYLISPLDYFERRRKENT